MTAIFTEFQTRSELVTDNVRELREYDVLVDIPAPPERGWKYFGGKCLECLDGSVGVSPWVR